MAEKVIDIILGSTFKVTWVSSGVTPAAISFSIFDGSESLVSSQSAVSSGNGHYYANAIIPDTYAPGLYAGQWLSTISGDVYKTRDFYSAFPEETHQPGRYTNWDTIVGIYPDFSDFAGAVKASSSYIANAEAEVDARLGVKFTTPFSSNNVTVRGLATDLAYLQAGRRSLSDEHYSRLLAHVNTRMAMLLSGDMVMATESGALTQLDSTPAWSTTEDYHPIFGPNDPLDWIESSAQNSDLLADRGIIL